MIHQNIQELLGIVHSETNLDKDKSITRRLPHSPLKLEKDLVLAIQGVRRSGKSTLMRQIARQKKIMGKSLFVNFEDPRFTDVLTHVLLDQIVYFQEKNLKIKQGFLFLDEIQNVQGWEKWLHIQLEKKKQHIVITGSNSTLLSGKLSSALTGRHITLELFPFDFLEYCTIRKKTPIHESIESYLEEGGFPRVLTFLEPQILLREYYQDIIERDVRRHLSDRSSQLLPSIAKAIFESSGSETSLRSLSKKFQIAVETIAHYINALEAAYVIQGCDYFTYSERKSVVRPKKYYPIDQGLFGAIVSKSSKNIGKKFEIAVLLHLKRKYRKVFYWRGKGEVDFVVETDNGILPIQVSWDGPKDRHFSALQEFKKEHPLSLDAMFIHQNNFVELCKTIYE